MTASTARLLRERLGLADPVSVPFQRAMCELGDGFKRERIEYCGLEGDRISAFLITPAARPASGGVVVFHQHNGEFHFGKSEVAGLVGDPYQAFGPALARRGLAVLAPDAISFEDRRGGGVTGVEPDFHDWLQHYNAGDHQALQILAVGAGIVDKVVGPDMIRTISRNRPRPMAGNPPSWPFPRHLQLTELPQPEHSISADLDAFPLQVDLDSTVAKPRKSHCMVLHTLSHRRVLDGHPSLISKARSGHSQQPASPTDADAPIRHH